LSGFNIIKMLKEKISTADAIELMYNFINKNLTAVDDVEQHGSDFLIEKGGIEIILKTTAKPIKPANGYVKEVKANSKNNITNSLIQVRSAKDYDGDLLKKAEYLVKGKNRYYQNKKKLASFEQEVVRLYGGPAAYFNPNDNDIELIKFIRTHQIPKHLQPEPDCDGSEQPKEIRKKRHMHENLRESIRKISITDRIKGPFTFEVYERKSTSVLVARIVPYNA
tara:strand:- start:2377 stop:3045 length:669 start_codon:yes stop_codon:yes gene_type:complete